MALSFEFAAKTALPHPQRKPTYYLFCSHLFVSHLHYRICQCKTTKCITISSLHGKLPEDRNCLGFIFISLALSEPVCVSCVDQAHIAEYYSSWAILQMHFVPFLLNGKSNYTVRYHLISMFLFLHCSRDSTEFKPKELARVSIVNSPEIAEGEGSKLAKVGGSENENE